MPGLPREGTGPQLEESAQHCSCVGLGDRGREGRAPALLKDSLLPFLTQRTSRLGAPPQEQPSVPASHCPRQRGPRADWGGVPGTAPSPGPTEKAAAGSLLRRQGVGCTPPQAERALPSESH